MKQRILTALIVALALTGCQTVKEVPVIKIVERKVVLPDSLKTCKVEPVAVEAWDSEREPGKFMVALAGAGQDCRTKLGAAVRIIEAQ